LLELVDLKHQDILSQIRDSKDLSDDTASKLKSVLESFTNNFKVSIK
jgi:F-type H+-transporting ATPase subunit alpha